MATQALEAAITGSGLVTAELSGATRLTSQVAEVAASGGITRLTSQVSEVLIAGGLTRVTSQVVEVIFPFVTIKALAADITSSILVASNLKLPSLKATITGSGVVVANAETPQPLEVGLQVTAIVTAIFELNLESTTSTISFTQSASAFNDHVGNTLDLTQSIDLENLLTPEPSDLSTLDQIAEYDVVYVIALESVLGSLDHVVAFKASLPVETASNTLSFTQDASAFNQVPSSDLVITQVAIGIIGGIPESASNTLSFTEQVSLDLVLIPFSSDTLFLTQVVTTAQDTNKSASNTLFFKHIAFAPLITPKCFVILQAPFDFLQPSIVLPCALFGDTENIVSEVTLRRSMNGATQTHIKTNSNRRLNYTFRLLDRQKAVEVVEFFKFYNSDLIRLTNWKGEVWKVNLLTNPIDFVKTGRFATDVSLEFEGIKLNG